ncbi:FAD-dependent oxidoreductase [Aestuariicella hydrocarbonica]|uniref:FAD-dependent oxidoreductase n=1 Tax=Pseudomaricurvus hydrocarbonicus TaxID=1470433 RepID=A0A9E5JXY9_9GAMM|nr:FAD-dependent oxidoreductase [Aestuariicella hydrocarbonica]NHO66671.1 FAD-dependent oxidoreductase [Aestuariicella hydrocarbonica]
MTIATSPITETLETDVVVIGSGGAGMTAACVAALHGMDVLLTEKTEYFGGTTAWSGGGIWVPGNSLAKAQGIADDKALARQYICDSIGDSVRTDLVDAFLEQAPAMVDFLRANTAVDFTLQEGFADWHPEVAGFTPSGRLLSPQEFNGLVLGEHFARLRPPLQEFNAPGGFMVGLGDMPHIANARKSLKSFWYLLKLLLRFGVDKLRYGRSTRLTMGNALAARLCKSCVDAGVNLWNNAPMRQLLIEGGVVRGVIIDHGGELLTVRARRGVIMATGGFSANEEMRRDYIPFADQHVSLVPEGNTGDGIQAGLDQGGRFDGDNISNAGWVVVSLLPQPDGSLRKFPHLFLDRGKPGCIAVNQQGQRFGNESATNLVEPMHRTGSVPAYLLCDHNFIKKYGLGLVRPGGIGLNNMLEQGYLAHAETLDDLARQLGIDPDALVCTIGQFNTMAARGEDTDFGRGSFPADVSMGDVSHTPNPCLGPILTPPFYAVTIFPGDSTTTVGLRVDAKARVLDANDNPIPGLQAIGLDMNSLWRGKAPGNGANNTLSLTFGYVAARALADSET